MQWTPTDVSFVIGAIFAGINTVLASMARNEAVRAKEVCAVAVTKLDAQDIKTVATETKLDTIQNQTDGVISTLQERLMNVQVELAICRAERDEVRRLLVAQATQRRVSDARGARDVPEAVTPS